MADPPNLAIEHGPASRTWIYQYPIPTGWELFLDDPPGTPFMGILILGEFDRRAVVPGHRIKVVRRGYTGSRLVQIRRADYLGRVNWVVAGRLL